MKKHGYDKVTNTMYINPAQIRTRSDVDKLRGYNPGALVTYEVPYNSDCLEEYTEQVLLSIYRNTAYNFRVESTP